MATLTLELPETPQAQPTYRVAADCPHCGAPLVLRQNRQTGALFTGCSAYPGCAFTEPHDARVQTLSTGLVQAVQTLATQVVQAQAETRRQVAEYNHISLLQTKFSYGEGHETRRVGAVSHATGPAC